MKKKTGGVTFGCLLATILSWSVNHSILYCILHLVLCNLLGVYLQLAPSPNVGYRKGNDPLKLKIGKRMIFIRWSLVLSFNEKMAQHLSVSN